MVAGAGFGGLAAAAGLASRGIAVTLVDRQNHHLFQPLLYQVATAGLSPADIAAPIRTALKRQSSLRVLMDAVTGVDPAARRVSLASGATLEYDALVLATGARVTGIDAHGAMIGDERLRAATIVWAAGVQASPAATWLGVTPDRSGRVPVGPDLAVPGIDGVFVIGDTAAVIDARGIAVPGVAPAAKQQGRYVARLIADRLAGRAPIGAFRYRNYGNLATIGRKRAVADFGWARFSGIVAWLLWSTAHIYFLVGFRNRLVVGANWLWHYLTFDRGARLITGTTVETVAPPRPILERDRQPLRTAVADIDPDLRVTRNAPPSNGGIEPSFDGKEHRLCTDRRSRHPS